MIKKMIRAIYCDDIRQEIGGKLSLMGVYNSEMICQAIPATMVKFCAYATLEFSVNETPKKEVRAVLLNGDQIIGEINADESLLNQTVLPSIDDPSASAARTMVMVMSFVVAPLHIEKPTQINLRAYIDGEELKGNALKVRPATPDELQKMPFPTK